MADHTVTVSSVPAWLVRLQIWTLPFGVGATLAAIGLSVAKWGMGSGFTRTVVYVCWTIGVLALAYGRFAPWRITVKQTHGSKK